MKLLNYINKLIPKNCALCNKNFNPNQSIIICDNCYKNKYNILNKCLTCMTPTTNQEIKCGKCSFKNKNTIIINGCTHKTPIASKIIKIKKERQFYWLRPLCNMLLINIKTLQTKELIPPITALLPVPLHKATLQTRGFNQSYLIASIISKELNLPVINQHIVKIKATKEQKDLNKKERLRNLKGCFKLVKEIKYDNIAIIDDVCTTGATINAIANILTSKKLQAWCLSRS